MTRQQETSSIKFPIHTEETAPEESRPVLRQVQDKYGFIPNLIGEFAESPAALKGYLQMQELLGQGKFSPAEQQLLFLTISAANGCEYCVAAHSLIAGNSGVEREVVDRVRARQPLADPRLESLRRLAHSIVEHRGRIEDAALEDFLKAGYQKAHVLEVILAVAMKTLSNYTNHILDTPIDAQFASEPLT